MSRKILDQKTKELFQQLTNEVTHIDDFYREYLCLPDRPWDSSPKKRVGRKKAKSTDLTKVGIQFAYAQIADELPSKGVLVDFIEGVLPFLADNYHHAISLLLSPQGRNLRGQAGSVEKWVP